MDTVPSSPTMPPLSEKETELTSIAVGTPCSPADTDTTITPPAAIAIPPLTINPVLKLLMEQELGKVVLGFIIPMTGGLLPVFIKTSSPLMLNITLISICIGLAALWNGLLLRHMFPKFAGACEQFGIAFIFFAFFGIVGSFLPPGLVCLSWACFGFLLLPLVLGYLPIPVNVALNP